MWERLHVLTQEFDNFLDHSDDVDRKIISLEASIKAVRLCNQSMKEDLDGLFKSGPITDISDDWDDESITLEMPIVQE